jgi:hypothetical protein
MNHKYSDATIRIRIAANLNKFKSIQIDDPNLRHAAVAIVVIADIDKHDSHSILLTLRTSHLKQHSGQYALPGGKLDPGETPVEAALRELHEELGISLGTENLLGRIVMLVLFPRRTKLRKFFAFRSTNWTVMLSRCLNQVRKMAHRLCVRSSPLWGTACTHQPPLLFSSSAKWPSAVRQRALRISINLTLRGLED